MEKLLDSHGLQHFAQRLISNGYDDVHFVAEVSDEELKEIGISSPADRAKVRERGRGGGEREEGEIGISSQGQDEGEGMGGREGGEENAVL